MLDVGIVCEEAVIVSGADSVLSPVFCVSTSGFGPVAKQRGLRITHIFFWHVTGERVFQGSSQLQMSDRGLKKL